MAAAMYGLRIAMVSLLAAAACGSSSRESLGHPLPVTSASTAKLQAPREPSRLFHPANPGDLGEELGRFQITYYWIAEQKRSGRGKVLRDPACRELARVPRSFARRLRLEGTGQLRDGRIVNVAGGCKCSSSCYVVANRGLGSWGVGVRNRPLKPFRSIAVDSRRIPIGTWIYVEELDGMLMPGKSDYGSFVHDGCVVADDRGGGVKGKQIDFFAGRRRHYFDLHAKQRMTRVTLHRGGRHCVEHARAHTAPAPESNG
jgi:3D (Asp-Asp-Asp) domain-containing protein